RVQAELRGGRCGRPTVDFHDERRQFLVIWLEVVVLGRVEEGVRLPAVGRWELDRLRQRDVLRVDTHAAGRLDDRMAAGTEIDLDHRGREGGSPGDQDRAIPLSPQVEYRRVWDVVDGGQLSPLGLDQPELPEAILRVAADDPPRAEGVGRRPE